MGERLSTGEACVCMRDYTKTYVRLQVRLYIKLYRRLQVRLYMRLYVRICKHLPALNFCGCCGIIAKGVSVMEDSRGGMQFEAGN